MKRPHSIYPQHKPGMQVLECGHLRRYLMDHRETVNPDMWGCVVCLLEDFIESDRISSEKLARITGEEG